jgi:hypothetical protein
LNLRVPGSGGTFSVTVSGRTFCSWSDYSNAPFITSPFEWRSGSGTVTFIVPQNTTGLLRTGSMYVAGHNVVVTQDP